jgi:hypothetical protein
MTETSKDQKTSSRALAGEERSRATSSQHPFVRGKKMASRRPCTAHATPDREETNFRRVCIKQHSGCWPPP